MSLTVAYHALLRSFPPQQLTLDGQRWELIAAGAGESVVLLPGGFGVAATSFQYLADLSRDHLALALSYPPGLDRIADLADGVATLLAACGVRRAHVVGGSASGAVAQVLVRRHPALVRTLVLAQTGPPRPERAPLALTLATLCEAFPTTALALLRLAILGFLPRHGEAARFWREHFADVTAALGSAGVASRLRALADYDSNCRLRPDDLAGWPGRVAILEAPKDRLLPAVERSALRALYPAARVELIPGGRHADSVTDPGPQLAAIRRAIGG